MLTEVKYGNPTSDRIHAAGRLGPVMPSLGLLGTLGLGLGSEPRFHMPLHTRFTVVDDRGSTSGCKGSEAGFSYNLHVSIESVDGKETDCFYMYSIFAATGSWRFQDTFLPGK